MPLTTALSTMLGSNAPADNTAAVIGAPVSLTDVATILRKKTTRDSFGSVKETWIENGTAPCKLSRSSGAREIAQGGAIQSQNDWSCVFNATEDVRPPYRLRINAIEYEVSGTDTGISGAIQMTAQLRRITK